MEGTEKQVFHSTCPPAPVRILFAHQFLMGQISVNAAFYRSKKLTPKFHHSKGLIICIIYFVHNGVGPSTYREEIDF